jgi:hypothetical protein
MQSGCTTCKLLLEGSMHLGDLAAGETISSILINPAAPDQLISIFVEINKELRGFSIEFYTPQGLWASCDRSMPVDLC